MLKNLAGNKQQWMVIRFPGSEHHGSKCGGDDDDDDHHHHPISGTSFIAILIIVFWPYSKAWKPFFFLQSWQVIVNLCLLNPIFLAPEVLTFLASTFHFVGENSHVCCFPQAPTAATPSRSPPWKVPSVWSCCRSCSAWRNCDIHISVGHLEVL